MNISVHLFNYGETSLGFAMFYGDDGERECHVISFGFLFFEVNFYSYIEEE